MLYLVVHLKKNLSNFIFRFYGQLEGSLSETSFIAISSLHGRLLLGNSFLETFQFFLHLPFLPMFLVKVIVFLCIFLATSKYIIDTFFGYFE